ncbi:hypothetical protein BMF94_1705 [Rhodotorula taiwanensis]|uniref:Derlin n=1 Tax=Rhodotorula taiwanensis TaxID=741276 RepID=A0A2S5BE64_9BASI|nr:hypothetical protein BMF94_1705 [Rhodotorula taiwanensis]
MDELAKIPPFTRTTIGGILAVTLPVICEVVSPYRIAFLPNRIANQFELWRVVTPFLFGGGGINLVFSLIMMYRSLVELEDGYFAQRLADMTWAFVLIGLGIIGLNTPLETPFLFAPFMMAVTHLWAQANSTRQVNLYGLINVPAPYFPFAMLGFDLLNGGPGAVLRSLTGLVAAHAYYYIAVIWPNGGGSNPPAFLRSLLAPPQLLINLLGNGPAVPSSFAGGSAAGGGGGATAAGRSWSTGFGTVFRPRAGGSTGGQRLGGTASGASTATTAPAARAPSTAATSTGVNAAGRAAEERQAQHRWGRGQRLGTD